MQSRKQCVLLVITTMALLQRMQLGIVPKCMSCHKATVVITGRAHCFRDCIYILRSSCFYEIGAHCLSWIYKSTSGNLKNSVIVIVVMIIRLNSVSEYWQVKITILAEIKPQNNLNMTCSCTISTQLFDIRFVNAKCRRNSAIP